MISFKLYKNRLTLNKKNPSQSFIMTHRKYVAVSVSAEMLPFACTVLLFCWFWEISGRHRF